MKFYILRPIEGLLDDENPWEPWYDKCFGMVVAAKSPNEARKVATENSSSETDDRETCWSDPRYSTCKELKLPKESELIIKDEHWA